MAFDRLTESGVSERLAQGLCVRVYDTVGSTNTMLRELAEQGAPEGTAVLACAQTNGRGRRGRSFFSPDSTGVYLSLLLRPDMPAERAVHITTAAAVSVCEAMESAAGISPQIKWVNDVLLDGKKLCGILTEAAFGDGGAMRYAVLGVGINVAPPQGGFPPEISDIAGSVLDAPREGMCDALAAGFLNSFWNTYRSGGDYMDKYRARCCCIGRRIFVLRGGESIPALATGLDDDCHLLVRYDDGAEQALSSGEISIRLGACER